jgi:hypothetical protein
LKQQFKNFLLYASAGFFPVFRRIFAGRAAIVMFHEIQRDCRSELLTGTSVELFEYTLSWLQREGWAIVSLKECFERLARNDRSAPPCPPLAVVTIGWLKTWASGVNGARTIRHQL